MGILIRSHKSPTHGLQLFQTLHALQQKAVKCEPKLFIIGSQCPGDGDGDGDGKIKIKSFGNLGNRRVLVFAFFICVFASDDDN